MVRSILAGMFSAGARGGMRLRLLSALLGASGCALAGEAHAEFTVCNQTLDVVNIAVGQEVVVLPSKLEFRVGDKIVIRNEDHVDHPVGPYFVRAGEEFSITFGAPGKFEGYCPVSEGKRYDIEVTA